MRYGKVFLIAFQEVIVQKNRAFVYFLMSLFVPLIMILFWKGANFSHQQFSFSTISTYYFFLIIAGALLMPHHEEWVAEDLIHKGNLARYLMKPFPAFVSFLIEELPWRLIQGIFGVIAVCIFTLFFGSLFVVAKSPVVWLFSICIILLAYILAFLYKTCLGLVGFWITEMNGLMQLSDIFLFAFAGYIAPLYAFPAALANVALVLPYSYMIYFPVAAIQGRLDISDMIKVILVQLVWIGIFMGIYQILWGKGLSKFTAVGQ